MAGAYDDTIDAGADFEFYAVLDNGSPVNITGWSARMQLRRLPLSGGDPALSLTSSPAAGLTIAVGTDGRVDVRMTAAQTAFLRDGKYAYDLELVESSGSPPKVHRVIQGTFTVNPNVTR